MATGVRELLQEEDAGLTLVLHGATAAERLAFARELCACLDSGLVVRDLPASTAGHGAGALRDAVREGLLLPGAILVEGVDERGAGAAEARGALGGGGG